MDHQHPIMTPRKNQEVVLNFEDVAVRRENRQASKERRHGMEMKEDNRAVEEEK